MRAGRAGRARQAGVSERGVGARARGDAQAAGAWRAGVRTSGRRRAAGSGRARQARGGAHCARGARPAWAWPGRACARQAGPAGPVGCSCTRLGFQLGFSTQYFS